MIPPAKMDPECATGVHVANGERVEILPREVVRRTAAIVGPHSAAAQSLACVEAGEHGPDALIVRPLRRPGILIVAAASNVLRDS